jgi:rare lipoprotein A
MKLHLLLPALLLAACGSPSPKPVVDGGAAAVPRTAVPPAPTFPKRGGYYLDDGPLERIPVDLATLPDAVPRPESLHRFANRPYSVLGREYTPLQTAAGFRQQGVASWYGRRYHGQKTSSGEPYDMFGMTAAHPTLPIPSYVRVTRTDTGKAVVVRINDRGPFLHGRLIDLSYAAAWKLDILESGSGSVIVESVLPDTTVSTMAPPPSTEPDLPRILDDVEDKAAGGGHYLQLGAFGSRENAESLRVKLSRDLGDLGDKLRIHGTGNLYRLQLGPWRDVTEARRIAERLKLTFELPSVLVR